MSYGLQVWNERGNNILNSDENPYRFVAIGEEFDTVGSGLYTEYRKDIEGRFTDEVMVAAELEEGFGGRARINRIGSLGSQRWYVRMRFGHRGWSFPQLTQTPRFYLMDRIPPAQHATGFGIEVTDSAGRIILNSSTPLVKVKEVVEVETIKTTTAPVPYVRVAPSEGSIIVVENATPGRSYGTVHYATGGNEYFVVGSYLDIKNEGGYFHVRAAEWLQELGEGVEESGYAMPVRCIIIEKPKMP